MANDNAQYEVMSIQKVTRTAKIYPDAQRMKHVRFTFGRELGLDRLSQAKFARILGTNPSTISHIEAGTTRIQLALAIVMEEKTGFSQAWLMTGIGPERVVDRPWHEPWEGGRQPEVAFMYVRKVKPVLSAGSGELVIDETNENIYSFRRDWLVLKGAASAMRLAQVSGDSMHPTLRDRDMVLFDTSVNCPMDGRIMVVGIDNLLYIKRIRYIPDDYSLLSDNKDNYKPWRINLADTKFLGLVIWRCGEL